VPFFLVYSRMPYRMYKYQGLLSQWQQSKYFANMSMRGAALLELAKIDNKSLVNASIGENDPGLVSVKVCN